jgi:hypothetical protein
VSLPKTSVSEASRSLTATLSRINIPLSIKIPALTVALTSSNRNRVTVPSTVTIPAGKLSVTFPVTLLNNRVADGDVRITITATASKIGLTTGTATLDVLDDDAARPRASLTPAAAPQADAALSLATASVRSGVQLRFWAALDVDSAQDALSYQVTINGQVVKLEGAAYDTATRTVTLALPEGALRAGDDVQVSWQQLKATGGQALAGTTQVLAAG